MTEVHDEFGAHDWAAPADIEEWGDHAPPADSWQRIAWEGLDEAGRRIVAGWHEGWPDVAIRVECHPQRERVAAALGLLVGTDHRDKRWHPGAGDTRHTPAPDSSSSRQISAWRRLDDSGRRLVSAWRLGVPDTAWQVHCHPRRSGVLETLGIDLPPLPSPDWPPPEGSRHRFLWSLLSAGERQLALDHRAQRPSVSLRINARYPDQRDAILRVLGLAAEPPDMTGPEWQPRAADFGWAPIADSPERRMWDRLTDEGRRLVAAWHERTPGTAERLNAHPDRLRCLRAIGLVATTTDPSATDWEDTP